MPDNKKTITWRSEAYSDVADSPPFRKHVVQLTEDAFARLLLRELRERGGSAAVAELREEWLTAAPAARCTRSAPTSRTRPRPAHEAEGQRRDPQPGSPPSHRAWQPRREW